MVVVFEPLIYAVNLVGSTEPLGASMNISCHAVEQWCQSMCRWRASAWADREGSASRLQIVPLTLSGAESTTVSADQHAPCRATHAQSCILREISTFEFADKMFAFCPARQNFSHSEPHRPCSATIVWRHALSCCSPRGEIARSPNLASAAGTPRYVPGLAGPGS